MGLLNKFDCALLPVKHFVLFLLRTSAIQINLIALGLSSLFVIFAEDENVILWDIIMNMCIG